MTPLVLLGLGLGALIVAHPGSPRECPWETSHSTPSRDQLRARAIEAQRTAAAAACRAIEAQRVSANTAQHARALTALWQAQDPPAGKQG